MKRYNIIFLVLLCIVAFGTIAWGQGTLLWNEDFNYPVGDSLNGLHGWVPTPTASYTNTIKVVSGNLSYLTYPTGSTTNSVKIDTFGQDLYHTFTARTSGSVYAAALVNFSKVTATGDYFMHFTDQTGSSAWEGRTFAKLTGGNVQLGINKGSFGSASYSATTFALNTTHLLVIRYKFNTASTTDDEVALWVDPSLGSLSEPTPDATSNNGGTYADPTTMGVINFRQGASASASRLIFDGLRIADNWFTALGQSCPLITLGSLSNGTAGQSYLGQSVAASGGLAPYTYAVTTGSLPSGLSLNPNTGAVTGIPLVLSPLAFTITATDANGCQGSSSYTLTFGCPTINLGALSDGTVGAAYTGQTVAATGGSGTYTYAMDLGTSLPAGLFLDPNTGAITGTVNTSGTYTFNIKATDVTTCTGTKGYSVKFQCPLITMGSLTATGTAGVGYSSSAAATPSATYTYAMDLATSLPTGLLLDPNTGAVTGTVNTANTYGFDIMATNVATGCTGTQHYSLVISCPEISLGSLDAGTVGVEYTGSVAATPSGTYTYAMDLGTSLPTGLLLDPNTGAITGTVHAANTYEFDIKATDATTACPKSQHYSVLFSCRNITLNLSALTDGQKDVPYSQVATASGGSGSYTFALNDGSNPLPHGLTIEPNGTLDGTPDVADVYTFVLKATDADGCVGTAQTTITIGTCPPFTFTPSAAALPNGSLGQEYQQVITVDGGTPPYTFILKDGALPTTVELHHDTITGTPTASGDFSFTLKATDGTGCFSAKAYTIHVCPDIVLGTLSAGTVGAAYTGSVAATPSGTYTYALDGETTLPTGLSLDPNTGAITGTVLAATTGNFTIKATDQYGCTGSKAYVVAFNCPTINITNAAPDGFMGLSYPSFTYTVSGGASPYSFDTLPGHGTLPTGLVLNPSTGAVTGNPSEVGTFTYTLKVTDAHGCVGTLDESVNIISCPTFVFPSLRACTDSVAYNDTIVVTGGVGPYALSKISGALPSGLVFTAATGIISGTTYVPGTYNFTIQAIDAEGCTESNNYSMTIGCPTINVTPKKTFSVLRDNLFGAAVFARVGGVSPFIWSQTGSLPAGVTFNAGTATVSGTPTVAGQFIFTITVTDANGCTGSAAETLNVIKGGVYRVANTGLTAMNWDSSGTWVKESPWAWNPVGWPRSYDTVYLDNNYHHVPGSYTIDAGVHARDSARVLQISYPGNTTNDITLQIPSWNDSIRYFIYGDGATGNRDVEIFPHGLLDNAARWAGSYGMSPNQYSGWGPDSILVHAGGKILWRSACYPQIAASLANHFGDLGTVEIDPPHNFSDINFGTGWEYPNLILSNTRNAPKYYCFVYGGPNSSIIRGDLTINTGVIDSLNVGTALSKDSCSLTVYGNIVNNGTSKIVLGKLVMAGGGSKTISGTMPLQVDGFSVINSTNVTSSIPITVANGSVITTGTFPGPVGSPFTVSGSITMAATDTMFLNPSGAMIEGTSPVTGVISARRNLTVVGGKEPFGNIGYAITPSGADPGVTTIIRNTGTAMHGFSGNASIKRNFSVAPTNTGGTAMVEFKYLPAEVTPLDESTLQLNKTTNSGSSWSGQFTDTLDVVNHRIVSKRVAALGATWTAASTATPLFVPHTITVKLLVDADGDINTLPQSAHRWWLYLYKDSLTGTQVGAANDPLNPGILTVSLLEAGKYIAVAGDSSSKGYLFIGKMHEGVNVPGAFQYDTMNVAGGFPDSVKFYVQAGSAITVEKHIETDGDVNTTEALKVWGLTLYKGTVDPANIKAQGNATSISATGLQGGRYIAVEADSGAAWVRFNGNKTLRDTIELAGGQTVTDVFTNEKPNTITASMVKDMDGSWSTDNDRTAHNWHIAIHSGSATGPVLSEGDAVVTATGLPDGTFYVVSADSLNWINLGYTVAGSGTQSTDASVAVSVASGVTKAVVFVKAPPIYSALFRTIRPDSLWYQTSNPAKPGTLVKAKVNQYDFTFSMTNADATNDGFHIEFNNAVDTSVVKLVISPAPLTKTTTGFKKWDIAYASPIPAGAVSVSGRSLKSIKVSKLYWTKAGVQNGAKVTPTPTVTNTPRLPMPVRVNALSEAYTQYLNANGGILIGKDRSLDSAKQYAWLKAADYKKVLASLYDKNAGFQLGQARGFDTTTASSPKPMFKLYKSISPKVQNNVLIGDLLALRLNIVASGLKILPKGLGELTYDDKWSANPWNGLTVSQIADSVNTFMSGYWDAATPKHRHFVDSSIFNRIHWTASQINSAFEGPVDTNSWSITNLQLKGVKSLAEVPYLHATEGLDPVVLAPKIAGYDDALIPQNYALYQNYPNPFNPTTTIQFDLPFSSIVTIKIYNILGQEVATLIDHAQLDEGTQTAMFNANNLASGVYFYRLEASSVASPDDGIDNQTFTKVSRMVLIK